MDEISKNMEFIYEPGVTTFSFETEEDRVFWTNVNNFKSAKAFPLGGGKFKVESIDGARGLQSGEEAIEKLYKNKKITSIGNQLEIAIPAEFLHGHAKLVAANLVQQSSEGVLNIPLAINDTVLLIPLDQVTKEEGAQFKIEFVDTNNEQSFADLGQASFQNILLSEDGALIQAGLTQVMTSFKEEMEERMEGLIMALREDLKDDSDTVFNKGSFLPWLKSTIGW